MMQLCKLQHNSLYIYLVSVALGHLFLSWAIVFHFCGFSFAASLFDLSVRFWPTKWFIVDYFRKHCYVEASWCLAPSYGWSYSPLTLCSHIMRYWLTVFYSQFFMSTPLPCVSVLIPDCSLHRAEDFLLKSSNIPS